MPYSFKRCIREVLAPIDPTWDLRNAVEIAFDPPGRTPYAKPLAESTVGVLASCAVYGPHQERFAEFQDTSIRVLDRDLEFSSLEFSHHSPIRVYAEKDLNVAYPIERMVELEAEGTIGRLAKENVSILGSVSRFRDLAENTSAAIVEVFERQGVDLLLIVPFCPGCHQAVSILARAIERRGLPTVMLSTLREKSEAIKPPRACFLDFPLGCPVGRPGDPEGQRAILRAALGAASSFGEPWDIVDLPFEYAADGSRDWEHEVDMLYFEDFHGNNTLGKHRANTKITGEKLAGGEREFAIRCLC